MSRPRATVLGCSATRLLYTTFAILLLWANVAPAQGGQPLHFFKNYFITGDYAVGGIGLRGQGSGGLATGTIHMSGANGTVPANAGIVAAFLYWQEIGSSSLDPTLLAAAKFRGNDITGTLVSPTNPFQPACWGSGGGNGTTSGSQSLFTFRADVLRYLPFKSDVNGKPTSGRLVNDSDLTANGFSLTTVSVADSGGGGSQSPSSGNQAFLAEGATLVVVYRTLSDPLRAVVIYEGGSTFNQDVGNLSLALQGFYDSSTTNHAARITPVVGDGDQNFTEVLTINGVQYTNPFTGSLGFAWDNPTFPVTLTSHASSVSMQVVGGQQSSTDCLSWSATVFSTPVQDSDSDALLDLWESTGGLMDPNGNLLPDIHAMGADPTIKDVFLEIDYFNGGTHSHKPSQAVIDKVGDALKNGKVDCDPVTLVCKGVRLHVDVNSYQGLCSTTQPAVCPDPYIIQGGGTVTLQGGQALTETACTISDPMCLFPGYPSTSWKLGFDLIKDGDPTANPPTPPYFDHLRKDMFHYVLFAHTLGLPKWRIDDGTLVSVAVNNSVATVTTLAPHQLGAGAFVSISGALPSAHISGTYTVLAVTSPTTFTIQIPPANLAPNGTYQTWGMAVGNGIPRSTSGVADVGGGDLMITLGLWDFMVGSDFMQSSTLLHELGHNLVLGHGGDPADPTNCKPNYQSSMNYLYQVRGLLDPFGNPHIDYSGIAAPTLGETSLSESQGLGFTPLPYLARWYAPLVPGSLDFIINTTPSSKHCDGRPVLPTDPATVRIDGTTLTGFTDWNDDGVMDAVAPPGQDVNFDGALTGLNPGFVGFNDWPHLNLLQLGGRRNIFGFSLDVAVQEDIGDLGSLDNGTGSLDNGTGSLDNGTGSLDNGTGSLDNGTGSLDNGTGGELDRESAVSLGLAANSLSATAQKLSIDLKWDSPNVDADRIDRFLVWRSTCAKGTNGTTCSLAGSTTPQQIGFWVPGTPLCDISFNFCDASSKNGTWYIYFVQTKFVDGKLSGPSNLVKAMR